MNLKGNEELERKADDDEPFAALAFKIMTDPHVGKLTYFRVYSRQAREGRPGRQHPHRQQGAHRPHPRRCTPTTARTVDVVFAGDIVAGIGLQGHPHRRHALRRRAPDRARGPRVPRAGHPRRRRAEDQGRPGQDGQGALRPVRGGPDLPGPHRRGDRPDHHLRHGRAAPRGARRPHAPRVQASTPPSASRRSPTARRSPRPSRSTRYTHKKQTGGSGQYAEVIIDLEPTGPGGGYEFVDKITGGRIPKEYIPSVDAGIQAALDVGRARRLPDGRRAGHAHRRQVPRRRLLGDGVQDRRLMAFKEAARKAKPVLLEPIMAVEVVTPEDYMGDVMGDLIVAPRARRRHGAARQRQVIRAHVPLSEMFGYVDRPALPDPGPGHLHHAVRQLPADAGVASRKRSSPGPRRVPVDRRREESEGHGQGEVRAEQAASEHRDDGSYRSWEDDVDGCDHEGVGGGEPERAGDGVRSDRQGAGGEAAGDHDQHRACGV